MLSMSQSDVTFTMRHIALMHESCHTYEWVMSHIRMSHVTHTNESCNTYEWVMSHIWISHVTHMNESYHTYEWVISDIRMSHVTHTNESCHTCVWVMSHIWMSHVTGISESYHTSTRPNQLFLFPYWCVYFTKAFYLSFSTNMKMLFQGFYAPGSDPPHKILRYWFYSSQLLSRWFPPDQNGQAEMICTRLVPAPKGQISGAGP
jgi:hypothetical protein